MSVFFVSFEKYNFVLLFLGYSAIITMYVKLEDEGDKDEICGKRFYSCPVRE